MMALHFHRFKNLHYGYIVLLMLGGCMIGPDYEKPQIDIPNAWQNKLAKEDADQENLRWWENFNDPVLVTLIETGIQNNLDLKMAESKILQSRAALRLATASLYPHITGNVSSTHNAASRDALIMTPNNKYKRFYELYSTELDASWEIDFFGALRRSRESSAASLEASIADADGVFLTMTAEIAQNYITLRSNQQQLIVAEKVYKDWNRLHKLNEDLFKAGLADESIVNQTKASRAQAHAALFPLKANIKAAIHRLSILMGQAPNLLYPLLEKPMPIPTISSKLFIGLPSEIIERRPDVRHAERKLAAATSQIGVAKGDMFPRFNLTSNIGYSSLTGSKLTDSASLYFALGPSATFSIFDFGRIRANIQTAEILKDQAHISYQQTILSALEDVENSLVNYSTEEKRYLNLKGSALSNRHSTMLMHKRYASGLNPLMDFLNTQIIYLNSQTTALQSQATLSQNSITLYKALGGGWKTYRTDTKKD